VPDSGGSVGSVQGTWVVLGGAVGVCGAFGIEARFPFQFQRLVAAFCALCCLLAGRVGRFALACARAVVWTRFARLVLVVRGLAMRTSLKRKRSVVSRKRVGMPVPVLNCTSREQAVSHLGIGRLASV
jgi:hypothetical protein